MDCLTSAVDQWLKAHLVALLVHHRFRVRLLNEVKIDRKRRPLDFPVGSSTLGS